MIKDLKDLKALFKLCRSHGIASFSIGEISFKLGDLPELQDKRLGPDLPEDTDNPYANFPDGILTPEQLMYYSAGGTPEDDPALGAKQ